MSKGTVSGITLTLLFIGMLTLAFNVQPVRASGTICIKADGSIDPPDAPISTVDNVTYTLTGNITSDADGIVVERSNIIIDGAGYTVQGTGRDAGIDLSDRSNVTIKNMTIKAFYYGVYLYGSYNTVSGNNITNNACGILLSGSSDNAISGNNITNNENGIWLNGSSNFNIISGNSITDNNENGILLVWSSNNTISGNNITNNWDGVLLDESSNNTISGNNIAENDEYGILLVWSSNFNIISGNDIADNNEYGILLYSSSSNTIYHNNFVGNGEQVCSESSTNVWDDGYPSGGNYWSDYNGTDIFRGIYQNETGSDGIGDTAYIIDANNIDHYPLMSPWTPIPPVINTTVDIKPQTLTLRSKVKWITAYIELPEGYNVDDINVSSILLNNTIPVDSSAPTATGDYDSDGVQDLMVKLNGAEVIWYILDNVNMTELIEERFMTVTLTITGWLNDGTPFQGIDTIRIIYFGIPWEIVMAKILRYETYMQMLYG